MMVDVNIWNLISIWEWIKTSYFHNITFDGLFIYVEYRNIMLHKHDMVDDNMDTINNDSTP